MSWELSHWDRYKQAMYISMVDDASMSHDCHIVTKLLYYYYYYHYYYYHYFIIIIIIFRLSGIDNSLLGYKPRIFRLIKHYRENIDTAMFG